ncbi:helix-turn-helix domain-containing protein [Micromonospora yasonensis]|uniref:helix-turn-helix transcriptional regulator n=1 Tax=Micromonospora yasonensis TaxID=1128667 RepID=UPI00222EF49F|nr:helix-turn-helix domain-containing protein [Micromonospora yasonensis]MCW3841364.1 helix-turn-helix domain-containing protein [Micromonospora yasonensis]
MYRERAADGIAGAVSWESVSRGGAPTRVLPDGCLDLLWSSRAGLLVAGPDRTAHLSVSVPGERWVGLRLPPGVGPVVFGVPAHELRDRRVPLADLWGREAGRLADRIDDGRAADAVLEAVAMARLRAVGGPDPLGARVAARLAAGASVAATAAEVGLGARALHRRSQLLFGYGPKTLARILRMRRALDLAHDGAPLAEVAAIAGYADQAHFTREVTELAGVPPTRLLPAGRA